MARADLSAMLRRATEDEAPAEAATPAVAPAAPAEPAGAAKPTNTTARPRAATKGAPTAPAADAGEPHYLTFPRKEARLREDQLDQLNTHARRLNRQKTGTGERITDNTLIRVAVDLLLARIDTLSGDTEDELRKSVGL